MAGEVAALQAELRAATLDRKQARNELALLRTLEPRIRAAGYLPLEANWQSKLATALQRTGDLEGARNALAAWARTADVAGDDEARVRALISQLRLEFEVGNFDVAEIERSAEAAARRFGNPRITMELLSSQAMIRYGRGDHAGALAAIREAVSVFEAVAIDAHGQLVTALQNRGGIEQGAGDLRAARRSLDEGYALARRRFGEDDPATVELRGARATNLMYSGDLTAARPELEAVATSFVRLLGEKHPQVAMARTFLCEADLARDPSSAGASCDRAMTTFELVYGRGHPQTVWAISLVGKQRVATKHYDQAISALERALSIADTGTISPMERPATQAYLALALHGAGRDRTRAVALAREALKALATDQRSQDVVALLRATFPIDDHKSPRDR
ncbi:MAG: tetratricopeptide repeat protein [Kofleriaceae bacterium]